MSPRAFVRGLTDFRSGVAWPGCYPVALLMQDGETCCAACARKEVWRIFFATREGGRTGWEAEAWFVHWEGDPEICCHCNGEIPSAYGPEVRR